MKNHLTLNLSGTEMWLKNSQTETFLFIGEKYKFFDRPSIPFSNNHQKFIMFYS